MFCGNCGKLVEEGNKFCTGCGQKITPIGSNPISENVINNSSDINEVNGPIKTNTKKIEENNYNKLNYEEDVVCKTQDKVNVWLVILGFLIPIVGLILFVTLRKNTPKKANAIGISVLISFIFNLILGIIIVIYVSFMTIYSLDNYDYNYDYDYDYDEYYYENYDDEYDLNKLENELNKYYNENKI